MIPEFVPEEYSLMQNQFSRCDNIVNIFEKTYYKYNAICSRRG